MICKTTQEEDSDHQMDSQPELADQPALPTRLRIEPVSQIDQNELTQQWLAENVGETQKVGKTSRAKSRQKSTQYTKPPKKPVQHEREREFKRLNEQVTQPPQTSQVPADGPAYYVPVQPPQTSQPPNDGMAHDAPVPPQAHLPNKLKSVAQRQYKNKRKRDWNSVREASRANTRTRQDSAKAEAAQER